MRKIIVFLLKKLLLPYRLNNDTLGIKKELISLLTECGLKIALVADIFAMSKEGIRKNLKG